MKTTNRKKPQQRKPTKRRMILVIGITLLLSSLLFIFLERQLQQKRDTDSLDSAARILQAAYDNILSVNKGNVWSSQSRNECSFAFVGPYDKKISCGFWGRIALKQPVDDQQARELVQSSLKAIYPDVTVVQGQNNTVHAAYNAPDGIDYIATYGYDEQNKLWYYQVVSRKDVPDFLPGYTKRNY